MVNRWHVCSLDSMSFEGIFDTKEKAMQQIELYKKSKVNNLILFKEAGRVSVIAANLKRVTFDSDSDFVDAVKKYVGMTKKELQEIHTDNKQLSLHFNWNKIAETFFFFF